MDVDAVDAADGPDMDEDELATEGGERGWRGRGITTYTIPIEGRDGWLAAARHLA